MNTLIHQIIRIIEGLAVAAAASSIVYYVLCLWSASSFLRTIKRAAKKFSSAPAMPPVSILKPLKGTDPEMYENLRSHCLQDYPEYEVIFGVSDSDDPAINLVERLQSEFPQRRIHLVMCTKSLGANTKVSNLAQMLPEARHEHILVNDSDIRVRADYLRRVIVLLQNPEFGLVTCLYRGTANSTLGSRLESLGISTDFCPGVLVARQLEGMRFGLGSTLAFRRSDLQAIGGFEAFVDYLADDYEIGNRIVAHGLKVELCDVVVETLLPPYTMREFLDHQLRWARTIRDARYLGYLGLGVTHGLPCAALALLLAHGAGWAWALLAVAAVMRATAAAFVGQLVLRDREVLRTLAWLPLRDTFALLVWMASFAGHTVVWRGAAYRLKNGKLARTAT